jgi:hypothetical protein
MGDGREAGVGSRVREREGDGSRVGWVVSRWWVRLVREWEGVSARV